MRSIKSAKFQNKQAILCYLVSSHFSSYCANLFSFGWPRKSFSLWQKVAVSRWGSLILWREGIKCNDGNVQTHQSHFSRPLVANQLLLIWYKNMKIWIFETKTPVFLSLPVTSLYLSVTLRDSRLSYTIWQINFWLKITSSINKDKGNFLAEIISLMYETDNGR